MEGLPRLREKKAYRAVFDAFRAGCEKEGFRAVHYVVLSNHVHMLVEGTNRDSLSRGIQGLLIRIARALNRTWGRRGKVFADRYHDRILRSPREVRNVLVYVLRNSARHGNFAHRHRPDPYSSGAWFRGWKLPKQISWAPESASPVARARTWLVNEGWRKHGRIALSELPAP